MERTYEISLHDTYRVDPNRKIRLRCIPGLIIASQSKHKVRGTAKAYSEVE
jgi:hypothetical protein